MPSNIKTWRQTLRDIPANHTDEAAYDLILARDTNKYLEDGETKNPNYRNLTHSVWTKP